MKCPFCKKNLNKNNGKHIYNCKKNNIHDHDKSKTLYIKYNYPYISNKNNLYNDYVIQNRSFNDIRDEYGISYRNIDFLLNIYNIKKRNKKESSKLSYDKYKKTCKEKYGVDNVSRLDNIKIKKNKKVKINNIIQEIKDKNIIYQWINNEYNFGDIFKIYNYKDVNLIKKEYKKLINSYYNHWKRLNDDEKNIITNNYNTAIESEITSTLDKLNITYIKNFFIGNDIYDIKIYNTNIIIDIKSDYWGANPEIYNKNDILNLPFKKIKASYIWKKDELRYKKAKNNNYVVITIWEKDIKNFKNTQDKIDYIISKLSYIS